MSGEEGEGKVMKYVSGREATRVKVLGTREQPAVFKVMEIRI